MICLSEILKEVSFYWKAVQFSPKIFFPQRYLEAAKENSSNTLAGKVLTFLLSHSCGKYKGETILLAQQWLVTSIVFFSKWLNFCLIRWIKVVLWDSDVKAMCSLKNVNSETSLNTSCIVSLFNLIKLWSIALSVGQLQYILIAKWTMETFRETYYYFKFDKTVNYK